MIEYKFYLPCNASHTSNDLPVNDTVNNAAVYFCVYLLSRTVQCDSDLRRFRRKVRRPLGGNRCAHTRYQAITGVEQSEGATQDGHPLCLEHMHDAAQSESLQLNNVQYK